MKTSSSPHRLLHVFGVALLALSFAGAVVSDTQAQTRKPNILVLWGDDIGYWNVSAYNQGMMGYKTPNINRIATGSIGSGIANNGWGDGCRGPNGNRVGRF